MHCSSTLSSGVAAAEDAVYALMEYLVAPMLPFVASGRELPSLPLQKSVAKQVHAVVVLYNYYYRKQQSQVEFLGFKSFCQLAVIVKPTLMGHMKLMHHADYAELDDVENQLSMTEKAIMNACDISSALDPVKNTPSTEGWEVSKVAVLLTDSSKENCLLQFSSTTEGVWSLIEKDFPCPGARYEGEEGKNTNKRKRNSRKSHRGRVSADEADLQQLALSAVKEATGISQGDLVVLESHIVYSLSREKSAVQFYIVQCPQSIDEDLRHSIKDIIKSLQGPLVKKRNSSWIVTPVVEYFHLLPYARIMETWFSREVISNSLQVLRAGMETVVVKSPQKVGNSAGNRNRDDSKNESNVVDFADMQSIGTDKHLDNHLEQKNNSGTREVGIGKVDVKSPHKVGNSIGNENRNDYKSETNVVNSANMQSRGTDNTKNLQQRNNTGTRGGSQDLKDEYSEMIDKLSVEAYKKNQVDCGKIDTNTNFVTNGCSQKYDEVLMENNNNGSVAVCKSDSPGGSENMGMSDSSMIYCLGAGGIVNFDGKSCQKLVIDNLFDEEVSEGKLKCRKKTNATDDNPNNMRGINSEASKQVTVNGNDTSALRDCHTEQKPTDTITSSKVDEVCKYRRKHNGKTDTDSNEYKKNGIKVEFSEKITNDKIGSSGLPNCHTSQQNMDIDDSSLTQLQNGNKERNGCIITKVYRHKKRASSSNSNTNGNTDGVKLKVELDNLISNTSVPKFKDETTDKVNKPLSIMCSDHVGLMIGDQAIVPYQSNAYHGNLQVTQTSKDNALSQTALKYLLKKKSKLVHQLRDLEDEIALCDKAIQTILDGGESELALQVEAIVDACYDTSLKGEAETQEWASQRFGTQVSPQLRRKILSDAVIPSRSSCQELDDKCHSNCWTLPTYQLHPVNGGFQASIKLKGAGFEFSEDSDLCVKPRLARESAAWKMIVKLQSATGQSH